MNDTGEGSRVEKIRDLATEGSSVGVGYDQHDRHSGIPRGENRDAGNVAKPEDGPGQAAASSTLAGFFTP